MEEEQDVASCRPRPGVHLLRPAPLARNEPHARKPADHPLGIVSTSAIGPDDLGLRADPLLRGGREAAVREALAAPEVVCGRFDVRFDNPRPTFRTIAAMMNLRSRLSGIFTGDQAIFVSRQIFEALGGYPDIPLMEDVELSRRLKRQGRRACLRLQVQTSTRKWERGGILRTIVLMWMLRLLYFVGVKPDRLHGWYYAGGTDAAGTPGPAAGAGDPASRRDRKGGAGL